MPHTMKLGFKDDPTVGSYDAIDLADTTTGYGVKDYAIGEPYLDQYGVQLRNITIQMEVRGATNDATYALLRAIHRYLNRTRKYFDRLQGKYSSRGDLTVYDRYAAVLTFKSSTATKKVYWNVMDGSIILNPPILGSEIVNNILAITVTLVVEAAARGELVVLKNLLPMGDFAAPFCINATFPTLAGGWAFTGTWHVEYDSSLSASPIACGQQLYTIDVAGTATSPDATGFATGDVLVPQLAYRMATYTSGTVVVAFQTWNGSAWSTQQTLATISAATGTTWTTLAGTAYTVVGGVTKGRLLITANVGTHKIYIGKAAIWLNPTGSVAPTEYMTYGGRTGLPGVNIYHVQGDVTAKCRLHLSNQTTAAQAERFFFIGQNAIMTNQEDPPYELDFRTDPSTTASTGLFWDTLPSTYGSGLTTASYTFPISFNQYDTSTINAHGRVVDRFPRVYRAFLMYAANDSAAVTSVQVALSEYIRTYNVALPQTYTGTGAAAAADYRLYDLGDFQYPRPGLVATSASDYMGDFAVVVNTGVWVFFSTSTNRRVSVGGVLLVPVTDGASLVDFGTTSQFISPRRFNLDSEGSQPQATVDSEGSYTQPIALTAFSRTDATPASSLMTGGDIELVPEMTDDGHPATSPVLGWAITCNRVSVLMLRTRSSTNDRVYTFNAQDTYTAWLEYFPRYLYGFR